MFVEFPIKNDPLDAICVHLLVENGFNQYTNIAPPILFRSQWVKRSAATRQTGQVLYVFLEHAESASQSFQRFKS